MNLPMLLTCEHDFKSNKEYFKNILPHGQNIPFTWRLYYYHTGRIFHPFEQIILMRG